MSVIQSIREKYAKWAVVAIALALLGFILTDYFQAKDRMGGGGSTTLGTINGKKIEWANFEERLKAMDTDAENRLKQQGRELTEADRHVNNERLWNKEVEKAVMLSEFKKVGIDIGKKEFNEWLFGPDAPQDLKGMFSDQQGNYDGAAAQNAINQRRRTGTQIEIDQLDIFLADLEYERKLQKFNSFLINSVYYPKWYVEKHNAEAAALAKVSYVTYPFLKITDSTIKVSDKEIEEYVSKHKEQFKQEENRNIAYVIFDASASAADSVNQKNQLQDQKAAFAADTMTARFISRNSITPYSDIYYSKTIIQVPAKDSIFALGKNEIYGPYLDGHTFAMAKMIDFKTFPDSVKCRHVLINADPTQGGFEDSIAAKKIDSVKNAINGGASWADMVMKYNPQSDGSRQNNGEMTFSSFDIQQPNFAKEFAQFILFDGKKGEKKVVKTSFGYHFIEILDLKNPQPHYKIAYFAKKIIASEETERVVLDKANKFSTESNDLKTFEANIAKSNGQLKKLEASNIGPNDISIQAIDQMLGMGYGQIVPCRRLIKEIYKIDKGEVLDQEKIGNQINGYKYIVATVTDILEQGTQPARVARPIVEPILVNKKREEHVKKMIAGATTLEAVAGIVQDSIITVDSMRMVIRNNSYSDGFPAKAIGAVFNSANKGKLITEAFAGDDKVFIIRVDDITSTSVLAGDIETQKAMVRRNTMGLQTQYSSPIRVMRNIANIKDNRRNFY